MSLVISLGQIQSLCSSGETYMRGMRYMKNGRVKEAAFDPSVPVWRAFVEGMYTYEVNIYTDPRGGLEDAECACPAFSSYDGYCKHIVALLLHLRESGQEREGSAPVAAASLEQNEHQRAVRDILDLFQQGPSGAVSASPVELLGVEYELGLIPSRGGREDGWLTVRLKVGSKRRYVVKNIRDFLASFEERQPLFFTKNFTYDPTQHQPAPKDEAMLAFLSGISRSEQLYSRILTPWGDDGRGNERTLVVPPDRIGEFLRLLPEGRFVLEHDGNRYTELPVMENRFPVAFSLNEKGESLVLQLEKEGGKQEPTLLSGDGYCFDSGTIYRLNQVQREMILPLYRRIRRLPGKKLLIFRKAGEAFASVIFPALKKEGCLRVDGRVSQRMVQHPLQAEIRLDRRMVEETGDQLTATLRYTYGEITVDPLSSGDEQGRDGVVLIRDMEKEQRIMNIFEESNFQFNGRELHLDDEEDLCRFLYEKIPQLEELAEVYATAAVRNLLVEPGHRPVSRIDVDAASDWLEVQFDLPDVEERELENLLRALVERKRYYRLPDGAFLPLGDSKTEAIRSLLEEEGNNRPVIDGSKLKLPATRALQLEEMLEEKGGSVKRGQRFRRLVRNLRDPENLEFSPPASLEPILRDYQRFGFQWMKTLAHYRFGGILADDMGLGKTIQALAFIVSELKKDASEDSPKTPTRSPALVVAPASLIYNWERECTRFAPRLKTAVIAGSRREREQRMNDLTGVDVLITSYPLLRRDVQWYEPHVFRTLILDEAQNFKNQRSRTAQAVRCLRSQTRFALSGTPIENSLDELGSICDVVLPGLFPGRPALRGLSTEQVARRIRPFILRRLKRDVLDELPEKTESIHLSELTDKQKELYLATLRKIRKDTRQALITDGFQKSRMKILAGLTRLRQICCHPSLYLENYTDGSGKFDQLLETLEERLKNDCRILVFSQFTSMLALIRDALDRRGISYHYLDGSTPGKERLEMAHRFNAGEKDLFLISLKAGGTGLNLTGADTVILCDLWWNPAVEQQAADRAHRIGQKKAVDVLKLIARGTIEEKIHELQQKKQALVEQVIQPGEPMLSSLSEKEIREILGLE
ncbi:SNF2 family DNA or RNA helicase [Melghirimyces profundicolus]|uniref:SNF2 family DNA or RNA helicase n=1 Tax=Melghirimyces profundicolus TaxID=1242148 RepID=A0A2T6BXH9_9BACL|nr:DEAD/DEAH box helicase [Melghirimyces profundicolus]PTX60780.1 SNF2 family DNA or RNA helicase [Melghirimyces profundicolus]